MQYFPTCSPLHRWDFVCNYVLLVILKRKLIVWAMSTGFPCGPMSSAEAGWCPIMQRTTCSHLGWQWTEGGITLQAARPVNSCPASSVHDHSPSKATSLGGLPSKPNIAIPMLVQAASFAVGGHQLVTSSVSDFTTVLTPPGWEAVVVRSGEDGNRKGQKGCFWTDEKALPTPLVRSICVKRKQREAGIVCLICTLDKLLMTRTTPLPEVCSLPTVCPKPHALLPAGSITEGQDKADCVLLSFRPVFTNIYLLWCS